jgi:hypothetical protein
MQTFYLLVLIKCHAPFVGHWKYLEPLRSSGREKEYKRKGRERRKNAYAA